MKIATWNINSVRIRLDIIKKFAEEHKPDIIMLQEIKTENQFFPSEEISQIGYPHQYFEGEKSYNGVAILSKIPFIDKFSLKFFKEDQRHVSIRINDIEIHNFYVPSGGDIPDVNLNPKFNHKLEYLKLFKKWFKENRTPKDKIILGGDLNIAPLEHDVWSSKQLRFEVSHTDIEREIMMDIIKDFDWQDIGRKVVAPSQKLYSWWSYRNKDWKKSNRGRRLDHIWCSYALEGSHKDFYIVRESRDWNKPSDHVPVLTTFSI